MNVGSDMCRTEELTLLAGRYLSLVRAKQAYQAVEDVHVERSREEVFDAAVVVVGEQPGRCTLHRSTCRQVDDNLPPVRATATGLVHALFPLAAQHTSDQAEGSWCLGSEAAAAQLHESLDQQELDLLTAVIRGGSAALIVAAMPALVDLVRREMSGAQPLCEIPSFLLRSSSTGDSSSPTSR